MLVLPKNLSHYHHHPGLGHQSLLPKLKKKKKRIGLSTCALASSLNSVAHMILWKQQVTLLFSEFSNVSFYLT